MRAFSRCSGAEAHRSAGVASSETWLTNDSTQPCSSRQLPRMPPRCTLNACLSSRICLQVPFPIHTVPSEILVTVHVGVSAEKNRLVIILRPQEGVELQSILQRQHRPDSQSWRGPKRDACPSKNAIILDSTKETST